MSGLATGTQTDTIRSEVWAIEQIGNRLYVGGRFTHVTNGATTISQPFLAAFDATTGVYLPDFAPVLNNAVFALEAAPDGSKLFVGGSFNRVDGGYTSGLVALDPIDGSLDNWSGRVGGYSLVRNLDLVGNNLYVVGGFSEIKSSAGTTSAGKIGRFDWSTGIHDASWLPSAQGGSVWGVAASELQDRVYLAGYFDSINGSNAPGGFKAVSASSGQVVSGVNDLQVNTTNTSRQYAYDVVTTNGLVFVGGSEHYVQVLNESNLSLRKFHMSQPSRGDYQDLEVVGDRVYAGCHCRLSSYLESADGVLWWGSPPWFVWNAPVTSSGPNSWVTAFSANTGDHVSSFVPNINSDGPGVWAIHGTNNGCVWFGGNITGAAGANQRHITRLCDGAVADNERPSTPGRPQIQSTTDSTADLAWNGSTDNVGVAGYRIYNQNTGQVLLDVASTSGTVTGLTPGTYSFYTRAYDAGGNESYRSGYSQVIITAGNQDTERPSTPGRPQIQSTTDSTADLAWNGSTDNVGVAGYRIYNQNTGQVLLDVASTSGTVTGLTPGTYSFYTRAYDAGGNESYRSGYSQVIITAGNQDTERPTPPRALAITGDDSQADLSWLASTDDVGVAGYRVIDSSTGQVVADVTGLTATVQLNSGTYSFFIKSYDAAGNQSWRSNIRSHTFA